jgi:hypothetical protein
MKTKYSIVFLSSFFLFIGHVPSFAQQSFPEGTDPNNKLLGIGLLDVTKRPYLADPTGEKDSTEAIQKAINDARDHKLVCFFPQGTYLISDTLSCEQENYKLESPRPVDGQIANYWHKNHRIVLLGSTKNGKRPVIKLSRDAKGFNDPSNPKIAIWIWARTWFGDGTGEQPNISFGHSFIGINIDIRGHAGAIGLKHSGSQGSTLQDSTIYAEGAYSGLYNCPGQAAGTYNIEVIGGDYGFFADSRSRFPILVGCRFRNQAKSAIAYAEGGTQVPTLLIGCVIENRTGKAIDLSNEVHYAGISLVDCMIRMDRGVLISSRKNENIFLENTLVRGAERITPGSRSELTPNQWTLIEQYSQQSEEGLRLVDGAESTNEYIKYRITTNEPDPDAIVAKHRTPAPSFEDEDAVNVKILGAKGDGITDDREAFKKAILSHKKIFVPPGNYKLTDELELKNETQIFSFSPFLCSVGGGDDWKRLHTEDERAMFTLSTPDDARASPGLWFIAIRGRVSWRSGNGTSMHARAAYRFSGNAGGKLNAIVAMGEQLLIEGIRNPLSFYSLNVERVTRQPQSVIRDSKHIRVYYWKVEAGTKNMGETGGGDENTPGLIQDSEDIRIYSMYGNVKGLSSNRPMLEIIDSRNIVVSQLKAFFPGDFSHLRETNEGKILSIPSSKTCVFYSRN